MRDTTVQTALDGLPYGPLNSEDATGPVKKAVIPEGVTSRRLLRGVGDTRYSAMVVLFTTLGVRAILSVIAVNVLHLGLWGAWGALFMDQLLRTVLILRRYQSGRWKMQLAKRTANEAAA